jgi:hypothetical protein
VEVERIDEAIRAIVEAQMMVVSFTTSVLNYELIDAYYDAGLASLVTGVPKLKLTDGNARAALKTSWSLFSTVTRMNLDARYRFVRVARLMNPAEEELWSEMEIWSEYKTRDHFERKRPLSHEWAVFALALAEGDSREARRIINDI